jgi:hypothetical protein
VAREGGPTWRGGKERAKGDNLEAADSTLLRRVEALERKLEEQKKGEEKRVEEAFEEGVKKQGLIMVEVRDEIEARDIKWRGRVDEEKQRNLREGRKFRGIEVKDNDEGECHHEEAPCQGSTMIKEPSRAPLSRPTCHAEERRARRGNSAEEDDVNGAEGQQSSWRPCTSSTGRPEAPLTDYRLRGPGADKIVVHRY